MSENQLPAEVAAALAAPFDPAEIKWKPAVVSGTRALAMCYVDARVIQDRLDEVLGVVGWQDDYEIVPDGSVICRLRIRIGGEWLTKVDVGSPSEQPDGGDRLKAAFSDSLKRAAVKWGISRYLYRMPSQWVDYDPAKKQFVRTPTLPGAAPPAKTVAKQQPKPPSSPAVPAAKALPANGAELMQRLEQYEEKLVAARQCRPGELLTHVQVQGAKAGWGTKPAEYTGKAIAWAVECVRSFTAAHEGDAPLLPPDKLAVLCAEFQSRINDLTDDPAALAEVEQEIGRRQKDLGRLRWEELTHALREKALKAEAMREAAKKTRKAKAG